MKNKHLALGGLFACMHVLVLLASKVLIGSELLLVLFLPLLSTLYTFKANKSELVMFVISTIFVCSIFDIIGTFIYVVPALVCGIVYGVLRKKKCKELELLCFSGLTHMLSLFLSFLVITVLFKEVDFMGIFSTIYGLSGDKLIIATLLTLLVLGFCEAFLVHVICDNELKKFNYVIEKNESVPRYFYYISLISFAIFIVLFVFNNLYSVIIMLMFSIFFIPCIVEGVMKLKYKLLTFSLIFIFSLISIFFIKYIEPLYYLIVILFVLSPFIINNFKDIKENNFKK